MLQDFASLELASWESFLNLSSSCFLCGSRNNMFSIIAICVSGGMFLKGVDERFLLSKDELLTPDIDEVMAVNVF